MLEKSLKKVRIDAHFHMPFVKDIENMPDYGCTCAHSVEEWNTQKKYCGENKNIVLSFGIHPQLCTTDVDFDSLFNFLESLVEKREVNVIGEAGFDYFLDDFKEKMDLQDELFEKQINLAVKYNLPMVVHCRKANQKLFENSNKLKKLPSVLFHSFMGSYVEAESLLNKGINGFFSFGNQIIKGNRNVCECVKNLPLTKLLCETDAPYQSLGKNQITLLSQINNIYLAVAQIKNEDLEKLSEQMHTNFVNLFSLL